MKASVIIPCKGRPELLDRLLISIINSRNADSCEIIVVDDFSEPEIQSNKLREQDKIIRLPRSSGAAVARNVGIDRAIGDVIYLIDSDDVVLFRDFITDSDFALSNNCLCFSSVHSQNYKSKFPSEVNKSDFFYRVLVDNPFLCQTSSLYFPKALGLEFDESLHKHQDWDFVYSQVLRRGIPVKKGPGLIFFDRSDKSSLSRKRESSLSEPWLHKMYNSNSYSDMNFLKYHLVGQYKDSFSLYCFITQSIKYLVTRRLTFITFLKKCYVRFF